MVDYLPVLCVYHFWVLLGAQIKKFSVFCFGIRSTIFLALENWHRHSNYRLIFQYTWLSFCQCDGWNKTTLYLRYHPVKKIFFWFTPQPFTALPRGEDTCLPKNPSSVVESHGHEHVFVNRYPECNSCREI